MMQHQVSSKSEQITAALDMADLTARQKELRAKKLAATHSGVIGQKSSKTAAHHSCIPV